MHRVKGLQFEHVFLAGLTQDQVPPQRAMLTAAERRHKRPSSKRSGACCMCRRLGPRRGCLSPITGNRANCCRCTRVGSLVWPF
ncbi:hypothetical protein [Leptolyngbya sp. BL0902]|uniref:hypothetical protein n=1 Tax=Leptolyngbya sp. BL0902 TaxID=1115757 RepID=UPI0018E71A61